MRKAACFIILAGWLSGTAAAQESTRTVRSFDRFELDAAVTDGLWSEVIVAYTALDKGGLDVDQVSTALRAAWGVDLFEAGMTLPFLHREASFESLSAEGGGLGDISMFGKIVPLRHEIGSIGAGVVMTFPSGDEDQGLGTGEVGFLPYFSGSLRLGTSDLRAYYGYTVFTGGNSGIAVDRHEFGIGWFIPVNDLLSVRTEFFGIEPTGIQVDPQWVYQPGLDFHVPLNVGDLILRPTGLVGLSSETWDWGIGGSIVYTFTPGGA